MASNEQAIDVTNGNNKAERWEQAILFYRENCAHIRSSRSKERVRCVAIMDTSYSMDGRRLICVKLGLCSLLANFEADDEVNMMKFDSKVTSVTAGFKPVGELLTQAPQLLQDMNTDGCTACYDAIVEGITNMRDRASLCQSFAAEASDVPFKNVAIALTDGEDNESVHTARSVERLLVNPRMSQFMFLMVAVDMTKRSERKFRSWMDLSHCKQVRVNVRTGSSLVGVFKEMLLCRILQTESTSPRFLQSSALSEGGAEEGLTEEEHLALRASLLRVGVGAPGADICHPRKRGGGDNYSGDEDDEDDMDIDALRFGREGSEGVSSVCSCSDGGFDHDDDDDCNNDWRGGLNSCSGSSDTDDSDTDDDDDDLSAPCLKKSLSIASSSSGGSDTGDGLLDRIVPTSDLGVVGVIHEDDEEEDSLNERQYPAECYCPISHSIMMDPVICADGHTYERSSIQNWLSKHSTSPNTNEELSHKQLVPNLSLRNLIQLITNQINKSTESQTDPSLPSISII